VRELSVAGSVVREDAQALELVLHPELTQNAADLEGEPAADPRF
jgi:hypothetical protein